MFICCTYCIYKAIEMIHQYIGWQLVYKDLREQNYIIDYIIMLSGYINMISYYGVITLFTNLH